MKRATLPFVETDGNDLSVEPQLAAAVISSAFQDIGVFERLLERRKITYKSAEYYKSLRGSKQDINDSRYLRESAGFAITAAEFLCFPNENLSHWTACLGLDTGKVMEESRKRLGWLI